MTRRIDYDELLYSFGGHPWTVRDSFQGTHIFGAIGSGKTSGSGRALALALLDKGYGGLVLTSSTDEAGNWLRYLSEKGRHHDLLLVRPSENQHFNFLDYEARRPEAQGGGITQNIASLFYEAMDTHQLPAGDNAYWVDNSRKLVGHAIDVILCSGNELDLQTLTDTISSAPTSKNPAHFQASLCARLIRQATQRSSALSSARRISLQRAVQYFGEHFPDLEPKQRQTFITIFTSQANDLLAEPLRSMFATSGPSTFAPELTHDPNRPRVIVLDLPIDHWGPAGRFAQRLYKIIWQRSALARGVSDTNVPLFLWCDEAYNFVGEQETRFQAGCRKYDIAGVYLAQNLPNYYTLFGGRDPINGTNGFLGSLRTKIFHQNFDAVTNEWASKLFARHTVQGETTSFGGGAKVPSDKSLTDDSTGGPSIQTSIHPEDKDRVPPLDFQQLANGEPPRCRADAIIYYRAGNILYHSFPTLKPTS